MGHTHIKTIETLIPYDHNKVQDKDRSNPVSTWMLLHNYSKNSSEGDHEWKITHLDRPQQ